MNTGTVNGVGGDDTSAMLGEIWISFELRYMREISRTNLNRANCSGRDARKKLTRKQLAKAAS